MHRLAAHGRATPCAQHHHAAARPAAGAGPANRVAAFRDAPSPQHSCCSVDTAHAAVASAAGDAVHEAVPQAAALPWQPLSAGVRGHDLGRTAGSSTYHTVEAAAATAAAAAAAEHLLLEQHLLQQQPSEQLAAQHSVPAQLHHSAPAQQQQHQHHLAGASWRAQHAAAVAQWRLLSEPGQDDTSAVIQSCSSVQQLLGVADKLLTAPVSKWHYARLAAMAAVLSAQQQEQQQDAPAAAVTGLHDRPHGSSSMAGSSTGSPIQHSLQQGHDRQQQQDQGPSVSAQLACRVLEAVTCPCVSTGTPALHALRGVHLAETLHAVQLLLTRAASTQLQTNPQQQQQQQLLHEQQQRLQQLLGTMPDALLLSAIHGCSSVDQLHSVVALAAAYCSALHVKAGFVQLARLVSSSSSSSSRSRGGVLWQQLLRLLPEQLAQLQPHHCASILWSLGQLQPVFGSPIDPTTSSSSSTSSSDGSSSSNASSTHAMQQRLLVGALSGLERLTPRVCAQLLHGAAKLHLEVPASSLQLLQQQTLQQLQVCDPHALSSMLWSFAALHTGEKCAPGSDWLQAFYSSSWRWLQPNATSSGNGASAQQHDMHLQQQQHQQQHWQPKGAGSSLGPVGLSAMLTAACRLQLQPPSGWLAMVADSCSAQMGSFQQQELGLLLWCFAKLQYVPPKGLLMAAAARAVQIGPDSFSPQSLSLLLYGMTRLLQWQQQQQQQQQHRQAGDSAGCVPGQGRLLHCGALQLEQWHATDLALLAWCLGQEAVLQKQQPQEQQQQQQQEQDCNAQVLRSLLQVGTVKALQQQYTPGGLSMLLWGCGTALQANSSSQGQQHHQQQQAGTRPEPAVLTGFAEAAAAAALQHAKSFSGHELSQVVWGIGAVAAAAGRTPGSSSSSSSSSSSYGGACSIGTGVAGTGAAAECLDVLFCQLLDASDGLSNYQLAAAIQGFAWARHPRGLDLLHVALTLQLGGPANRLQAAQPQELLLLLRACVKYGYVPEGAAWGGVVAAVDRMRPQLRGTELAQLLYLLGKLQMQSNRRAKQRAAAAAASKAAAAAAAPGAWRTQSEQRQHVRQLGQRQALARVVLQQLVPDMLLSKLLEQAAGAVEMCDSRDVSLMLWGVSHLHQPRQQQPPAQSQQQRQQPQQTHSSSSTDTLSKASSSADQLATLLGRVYPYALQHLDSFAPGNLATLLYALHRLRARPDTPWLTAAAMQFSEERLSSMDGQSLAVLALALAGLNWVPPQPWLGAFVRSVAAADRRGVLVTNWQRQCISNSLAALNPMAGRVWVS